MTLCHNCHVVLHCLQVAHGHRLALRMCKWVNDMGSQTGHFLSPEQWGAVKGTITVLNTAEANDTDGELPTWQFELRDHLQQLVVTTTHPVQPFGVSEHFLYLLDLYVAGAATQTDISDGTRLFLDWCATTLHSAAELGLVPAKDGEQTVWLVIRDLDEDEQPDKQIGKDRQGDN